MLDFGDFRNCEFIFAQQRNCPREVVHGEPHELIQLQVSLVLGLHALYKVRPAEDQQKDLVRRRTLFQVRQQRQRATDWKSIILLSNSRFMRAPKFLG